MYQQLADLQDFFYGDALEPHQGSLGVPGPQFENHCTAKRPVCAQLDGLHVTISQVFLFSFPHTKRALSSSIFKLGYSTKLTSVQSPIITVWCKTLFSLGKYS